MSIALVSDCAVATGERVACGEWAISTADCVKLGCCVDPYSSACYYPLDGKDSVHLFSKTF